MNVFVINSGSSSIKYQLIRMPEAETVCSGLIERIGLEGSAITHKTFTKNIEQSRKETVSIPDHATGLRQAARLLTDQEIGVINFPEEIDVVGHRVVHGGESFSSTMIINDEVKREVKKLGRKEVLANYVKLCALDSLNNKGIHL